MKQGITEFGRMMRYDVEVMTSSGYPLFEHSNTNLRSTFMPSIRPSVHTWGRSSREVHDPEPLLSHPTSNQ